MSQVVVPKDPAVAWKHDAEILLVITDGDRYNEAVQAVAQATMARFEQGVFITANRPHSSLSKALSTTVDLTGMRYVDCITAVTGILPPDEPNVIFIESPNLLEKTALRAERLLRTMKGPCCLILDSLSTLAVYNGEPAVAELTHNLVTRLRVQKIPAALLVVETQAEGGLIEEVAPHCDRIVRL